MAWQRQAGVQHLFKMISKFGSDFLLCMVSWGRLGFVLGCIWLVLGLSWACLGLDVAAICTLTTDFQQSCFRQSFFF